MRRQRQFDTDLGSVKSKRIPEQYMYFKDIEIVEKVVKHLSHDLSNDSSVIFESSPGTGLLTQQLLKNGAQMVRVFEDNSLFLDDLKKIQKSFPKRLEIFEKQIINLPKLLFKCLDNFEDEINCWFNDIPVREWRSQPSIKFVAVLSPIHSTLFLRFVIRQLAKKDIFFSSGRTQFFVFISDREYKYMTAKPTKPYTDYRSVTVIYNTFFDIESLETVPYNRFGLYPNQKIKQKEWEGNANLVCLTPKPYLDDFDEQTLKDYLYFVTQTFMKRKNWIIPFLENWFPNCGPELIRREIPVFKYFGELSPEEMLDLFKYLQNRSDYNNSLYKSVLMKDSLFDELITIQDKTEDEDIDSIEKEELSDNE